jgi:Ca2+-transporting ATPase
MTDRMEDTDGGRNTQTMDAAGRFAWHCLSIEKISSLLNVKPLIGLSANEAQIRDSFHGLNRLPEKPLPSAWIWLPAQFKNIAILVLLLSAGLAAAIGNYRDGLLILAVAILNICAGIYQMYCAGRDAAFTKRMLPQSTHVRRDGKKFQIDAELVVPGDIVLLEVGDRVPADGRLIVASGLAIDESALTGESHPADKHVAVLAERECALAERRNMAYMNTLVVRGCAEMAVTAIGMQTEVGRLSQLPAGTAYEPDLLPIQIRQLGTQLSAIALTLLVLFFFLGLLRGAELIHIVMEAAVLSMAAIPEGLPAIVTVALVLGMQRMTKQQATVKRLAGIEPLGCTTVICSDKTGILTFNQMSVHALFYLGRRFTVSGETYCADGAIQPEQDHLPLPDLRPLLEPLAACNDSRVLGGKVVGDPMEATLLALAEKGGVRRELVLACMPRVAEIPFNAACKYMATFHVQGQQVQVFVKGAPDVLLRHCSHVLVGSGKILLDQSWRSALASEYRVMARRGLRGLLVAMRTIPVATFLHDRNLPHYVSDLTFIGLIGLRDPPRPEAKRAIALCRDAGIKVKIITGDHTDSASATARELGIRGATITGSELDAMDEARLACIIDDVAVFARMAPWQKTKIVQALKANGHVVAISGKEAAGTVLIDDNFAAIVNAVRLGRTVYDNIRKLVRFQLATTVGAVLTIFVAPLAGLPDPFNATRIAWIALIVNAPVALALACDSERPGLMHEQPRQRIDPILSLACLCKITAVGATMMAGTLATLYYDIHADSEEHARTLALTAFVLFQFFNVFNARADAGTSINRKFFDNHALWGALIAAFCLQLIAVQWQVVQPVLQTTALSPADWLLAIAIASSVWLLDEARKLLRRFLQ